MSKVAILILAAGSSSRMKATKQLLPYKKTTLLGWTIENAQKTKVVNIFCVLGANKKRIETKIEKYHIELIYNPNFKKGLSSSIISGVKHISKLAFDSILILLADQPKITYQYLNEMLEVSEQNPSKIIAADYGKKIGVPAIFPKKYFPHLLKLKGDIGAKQFLSEHKKEIISIKNNVLIDIDTKEEYLKLMNSK